MEYHTVVLASFGIVIIFIFIIMSAIAVGSEFDNNRTQGISYILPITVSFVILFLAFISFDVTVNKEIKPTEIIKSDYGIIISYSDESKYIRDQYVINNHSDSTKVQFNYNERYLPFGVFIEDFISYEINP